MLALGCVSFVITVVVVTANDHSVCIMKMFRFFPLLSQESAA